MNPTDILNVISGCLHDINLSHGLIVSLFLAGLVGGATHCVGMCGPFIIVQAGKDRNLRRAILLPYHFGRITTYITMAVLLSTVLNTAFLFWPVRSFIIAPILALAGLIFLVNAFPALRSIFPWTGSIRPVIPEQWFSKPLGQLVGKPGIMKQYLMGILLGFMPCGLILSAFMAAATAPSPLISGVAMAAFGVGTMPALIGTAFAAQNLQGKFPRTAELVSKVMMTISALWLFTMAGLILM